VPEFVVRDIKKMLPKISKLSKINFRDMSEADAELLFDAVYFAVGRKNGSGVEPITREAFDELPVKMSELLNVIPLIAKQAGMVDRKTAEAAGGGAPDPSTGTTS
jgi:hypothetical protein